MKTWFAVVLAGLCAVSVSASERSCVRGFSIPAKTSVPYTYCISYQSEFNKPFLETLKESPPDLFHVWCQTPFKGGLGPTYGCELFTDDILPPDQVSREVERIRGLIQDMRSAGVKRMIPYVFTMAFFGQPDKRTGFFHFYDNWDDYRIFGLGPKPEADPSLWSQVTGPHQLGGGPPGILHYSPCVNRPDWSEYLDLVVRQIALAGYDGMFFDVNTEYCYCPYCQEKFDIYLLKKYGKKGLRDIFGTDDHQKLNIPTIYRDFERTILDAFKPYLVDIWKKKKLSSILGVKDADALKLEDDWRLLRCYMQDSLGEYPPRNKFNTYLVDRFGAKRAKNVAPEKRDPFIQTVLRYQFREFLESKELASFLEDRFGSSDIKQRCRSTPQDLLLWVEAQRFWCDSIASMFARLKCVGRKAFADQGRGDDFYTVANLGGMLTVDSLNKRRVDGIDLVRWARTADLQMFEQIPQPGSLESGVIISYIFAFKWAMAAGTQAGTLLNQVRDDRAADLAEAEVAAGGGGALIQPGIAAPESRKRWNQFFAEHADLWDNGSSWARVGVLFWSDQVFYEYPEHLSAVRQMVNILAENQIPFDLITEEGTDQVYRYDVVFAPMLRYLDTAQIEQLLNYVKQGGKLVIINPFGAEDKYARPRSVDPLAAIAPTAGDFRSVSYGNGTLIRLQSKNVPKRRSEQWRLMEERGNSPVRSQAYLNAARKRDLENGVDLGSKFVKRLEKTLGMPLRWCPVDTDSGIYVNAFRIPSYPGRPERIVAHLVNYRVPVILEEKTIRSDGSASTRAGEPVVMHRVRIRVPLPEGAKVTQVETVTPTEKPGTVEWSQTQNVLNLDVDQLTIYKAVVIDIKGTS